MNWLKQFAVYVITMVVTLSCCFSTAYGLDSGQAGFGKEWIRNNNIFIGGLRQWTDAQLISDMDTYLNANHTYYLTDVDGYDSRPQVAAWTEPFGTPVMRLRNQDTWDLALENQVNDDLLIPTLKGFILRDEALTPLLPGLGVIATNIRSIPAAKDKLVWFNMALFSTMSISTLRTYIDDVETYVNPDIFQYDNYPFMSDGTTEIDDMVDRMMLLRERGLAAGKPYWAYMQSYANSGAGAQTRVSSESDMRMQAYAHLTVGYTGFTYYTYNLWNTHDAGLLDSEDEPDTMYYIAQDINQEIQALGQHLKYLTSTNVGFIPGDPDHSTPGLPAENLLSNWTSSSQIDPYLYSVDIEGSNPPEANGLLGHFTDDTGKIYFMITNLNHAAGASASSRSLTFNLKFNTVSSIWHINRETGVEELVSIPPNKKLSISIPGGTGELYRYE